MENRLRYEFAYLGDTTSGGFDADFPGLEWTNELAADNARWFHVTPFIEAPDVASFEFGASDDETEISDQLSSIGFERAISTKFQVFGPLYQYVYGWLVTHENASINSIQVRVYDMLCNKKSLGIWQINTENLRWCDDGECRIDIN